MSIALMCVHADGWAEAAGRRMRVALGTGGVRLAKREGDGATPAGTWHPVAIRYRAGRVPRPQGALPVAAIRPRDGWCDAAGDPLYNRPVRHPFRASAEEMWRADHLYDLVVILDHNADPVVPGAGSAVFMHLARTGPGADWSPTAGCVAFTRPDLVWLVSRLTPATRIRVLPPGF